MLTGSLPNQWFTKIHLTASTSIWIKYFLKNLPGLYSGSLKIKQPTLEHEVFWTVYFLLKNNNLGQQ